MKMNKINPTNNLMAIGGGVAAEVAMDLLDTKVDAFSKDPMYSPLAVIGLGILGEMFLPKQYENVFIGMQVVGGVELAREQGLIKGINTALGDIVNDIFDKASRTVTDKQNKNPYITH